MKKGKKVDPPPNRFSDNPKYPPKKNLAKTPRTPLPGFPTTVHLCFMFTFPDVQYFFDFLKPQLILYRYQPELINLN